MAKHRERSLHWLQSNLVGGGGKLSTGQRQLIALARAVPADPQLFIVYRSRLELNALGR